jgi:hypothetical protein
MPSSIIERTEKTFNGYHVSESSGWFGDINHPATMHTSYATCFSSVTLDAFLSAK